ncbi:hypothetical protein HK099_003438 [Clydaea vesicula]|uniref:Large ribosomal subunit protein uL2 C-terminal domain-containing protein n=1 Tax=Clydaea vesicula TaxID=447962 RepID=A0AAD5XUA5_9FUNG|nr:hypothetical protein HK099_003438 [Clydaea vesicula]
MSTNQFSYILLPKDVQKDSILYSWANGITLNADGEAEMGKSQMIRPGNCLQLKDIPVGTTIHNIALRDGGPAKLCRSAGTYGQVLFTAPTGHAQVRLSSKEVRLLPVNAIATIGIVGNLDHHNRQLGKAGVARRMGRRPIVRGIAQSPYNHPHGGGRKSKGNKAPRSPWGWKTKGWKTVRRKKWYIVTPKRLARQ